MRLICARSFNHLGVLPHPKSSNLPTLLPYSVMSSSSKRASQSNKGGPPKKQRLNFKMRDIPASQATPSSRTSAATRTSTGSAASATVDTRSFQIYDRPNGRLGMRHTDSKVTVPVVDSQGQPSDRETLGLGGFPDEVVAIVGEYPVDNEEDAQGSETQMKRRRARPELRAAVSLTYVPSC